MKNKILLGIVSSIFLTVLALVFVVSSDTKIAQGSVSVSNEYNATSTDSTFNTKQCQPVLVGEKVLGSVIVTLTSNAPLYIYDATTTGPHANHATTTIVSFKTTPAGTYTFDVMAKRGLCVVAGESTVGVASTTITTRTQ